MTRWKPKTPEDRLLHAYWKETGGGTLLLEVPVGSRVVECWPPGSAVRHIDAVRALSEDSQYDKIVRASSYRVKKLVDIFSGAEVEVIEAKNKLNRFVFRQAVAGAEMFEKQYQPWIVHPVVIYEKHDPAMEWIYSSKVNE